MNISSPGANKQQRLSIVKPNSPNGKISKLKKFGARQKTMIVSLPFQNTLEFLDVSESSESSESLTEQKEESELNIKETAESHFSLDEKHKETTVINFQRHQVNRSVNIS